jgi:DNA-binding NtrC family response regulator
MPHTLLVVDDEAAARYALRRIFASEHSVFEAGTVAAARDCLATRHIDLVLLDQGLPGEDGLTLLKELATRPDGPAVVMITAHGSERLAVEAMKHGAYDYLAKPYDVDELRLIAARALERQDLQREVQGLRDRLAGEGQFGQMVGASPLMLDLFQTAHRVAASDLPVLILGESGSGKDLLAQEIHARSPRARGRFVPLNCAALPESLVESELFGYEKGAFTNALNSRTGKFEQAHQGTLFLDEIGDMALPTQAKILRAVESGAVERLGGTHLTPVDVRIVSATHRTLDSAIRDSQFREDLFFRLAGVTLSIPPLRQRREDIPLLVEHFHTGLQKKYSRPGPRWTSSAIVRLQSADWPGNVRQLRNVVERLFVLPQGDEIREADVNGALPPAPPVRSDLPAAPFEAPDFREARRLFEIEYLNRKLRENNGNVARTAAAIGFARQSLQEKIKELGLVR